jgi:hypothetical protein
LAITEAVEEETNLKIEGGTRADTEEEAAIQGA